MANLGAATRTKTGRRPNKNSDRGSHFIPIGVPFPQKASGATVEKICFDKSASGWKTQCFTEDCRLFRLTPPTCDGINRARRTAQTSLGSNAARLIKQK